MQSTPLTSYYPVICIDNLSVARDFYMRHFGFEIMFEADWYISLKMKSHPRQYEIALLDYTHETIPDGFRQPVQGLLLNFEVEDADAEYQRLVKEAGLSLEKDIVSEAFGQRHFIISDPNGVLLDIIQEIPPSPEFAAQFLDS